MQKQVLTALALMSIAAASCKVDVEVAPVPAPVMGEEFVISAVCSSPETRMERDDDAKMYWSPGDEIGVFLIDETSVVDRNERFAATLTAPACTTDFVAVVPNSWDNPAEYYAHLDELWSNDALDHIAIYPYNASMGGGVYTDYFKFMFRLSNIQQGIPGTFDPACWVAVARSKNDLFNFSYPFGGVKFSVVSENVSKVTLTCGELSQHDSFGGKKEYVSVYSDGHLYISSESTMEDPFYQSIELIPQGGTFIPGKAYYFVTPPCSLEKGVSFYFEKADGSMTKRSVVPADNQSIHIKSGAFRTLMEADSGCEWKSPTPDVTPTNIEITKYGGEAVFDVKCSIAYTVTCTEDWLVDMGGVGDAVEDQCTHTFVVKRNYGASRSATINVTSTSGTVPVTVTQAAGEPLADYPSIVRHHLALGLMSTSCFSGANPYPLWNAKKEYGDLFEYVTIFDSTSGTGNECRTELKQYNIKHPDYHYFFDGRRQVDGRLNMLPFFATESDDVYPTLTSIGVSSSTEGKTISVDLTIYSYIAQEYRIAAYVTQNVKYASGTNSYGRNYDNVTQYKLNEDDGNTAGETHSLSKGDNAIHFSRTLPVEADAASYSILVYVLAPFDPQPVIRDGDYQGLYYIDNCRLVPVGSTVATEVTGL